MRLAHRWSCRHSDCTEIACVVRVTNIEMVPCHGPCQKVSVLAKIGIQDLPLFLKTRLEHKDPRSITFKVKSG